MAGAAIGALPRSATLIVIDLQKAIDHPAWTGEGPRGARDMRDMALANLAGEYAAVVTSGAILAALP